MKSGTGAGGRKVKRKTARTEILNVRISKEHKALLAKMVKESKQHSKIISQADIVTWALERYAAQDFQLYPEYK